MESMVLMPPYSQLGERKDSEGKVIRRRFFSKQTIIERFNLLVSRNVIHYPFDKPIPESLETKAVIRILDEIAAEYREKFILIPSGDEYIFVGGREKVVGIIPGSLGSSEENFLKQAMQSTRNLGIPLIDLPEKPPEDFVNFYGEIRLLEGDALKESTGRDSSSYIFLFPGARYVHQKCLQDLMRNKLE